MQKPILKNCQEICRYYHMQKWFLDASKTNHIAKFKQNNSFSHLQKMDLDASKTNPRQIETK
jgi:hypothetical protein